MDEENDSRLSEEFWRKQEGEDKEEDSSLTAVKNIADQCNTLFQRFLENGVEPKIALALTQTYMESIIRIMLNK